MKVAGNRGLGLTRKKRHPLELVHLQAQIDLDISLFPHLRESREGQFIQQFNNVIKDPYHSSRAVWPSQRWLLLRLLLTTVARWKTGSMLLFSYSLEEMLSPHCSSAYKGPFPEAIGQTSVFS